jgi:hypothetical protein
MRPSRVKRHRSSSSRGVVVSGCVSLDDGGGGGEFLLGGLGPLDVEGRVHAFLDGVEVAAELVLGLVGNVSGSSDFGWFGVEGGGVFEHLGHGVVQVAGAGGPVPGGSQS